MIKIGETFYKYYEDLSGVCSACDNKVTGIYLEINPGNNKPHQDGEILCRKHFEERAEMEELI